LTPAGISADDVMRGFPVPVEARITPATVYRAPFTRWFMQHVREVERTAAVPRGEGPVWELPNEPRVLDEAAVAGGDGRRWSVNEWLAETYTDAVLVLHQGTVALERYFGDTGPETQHMYQSVSKSVGACVCARLIERGLFAVQTPVTDLVPELRGSGYDGATVRHLLDMRVGVRFREDYDDQGSEIARLDRLYGVRAPVADDEPGSSYDFAAETVRDSEHGGPFHYVSLNLQVLGWLMERATGVRLPELIGRELWGELGTEHEAYIALDGAGSAQLEGGFCSSLRDLARFGLMLCRSGRAEARQVVPAWWIDDIERNGDRQAFAAAGIAESRHLPAPSYRDNFWVAAPPGHTVFMGIGIFGQFLYVNRAADLVVAKFATQPTFDDALLLAHDFNAAESLADALV
jgi:CubicO group peptidase (beta-lactamase class C family)